MHVMQRIRIYAGNDVTHSHHPGKAHLTEQAYDSGVILLTTRTVATSHSE